MGIKITNVDALPALQYDQVFMDSMEISQLSQNDNAALARFDLRISYRIFAVDGNNKRHFAPKVTVLTVPDYLSLAMTKAQAGDVKLLQALQAIEQALAVIIEDQTDLGQTELI